MIDRSVYGIDHIRLLQGKYATDPGLLERALYAFGLLEAITVVGLPFCFKGGTSLMLILDRPARLSTDIDIMVAPGTKLDDYLAKAAKIFPFIKKEEDIRKGRNGIEKRHFKFTYFSPVQKRALYILLDIVFAQHPYARTIHKEIKNELLLTKDKNLTVELPTADCILADKLTAFAPRTTGVRLGKGRELEIAKQLFDTAELIEHLTDFRLFSETYYTAVAAETAFRGEDWPSEYVLSDTIRACLSIISRGKIDKEAYKEYLCGIKALKNHVLRRDYNTDDITWKACKVMHLASCLLSGRTYQSVTDAHSYLTARLEGAEYVRLAYVRKQSLEAYAHLVEATRNLQLVSEQFKPQHFGRYIPANS